MGVSLRALPPRDVADECAAISLAVERQVIRIDFDRYDLTVVSIVELVISLVLIPYEYSISFSHCESILF
jgi:hypothetical protein